MSSSRTFYFAKRVFGAGELARAMRELLAKVGMPASSHAFTIGRWLPDGTRSETDDLTADDLEEICDPSDTPITFSTGILGNNRIYVGIAGDDRVYSFHVEGPKPSAVAAVGADLKQLLALDDPPPNEQLAEAVKTGFEKALRPLHERLDKIEAELAAPTRRLHCFLSYRFADENELTVLRLQQFLSGLDVEVITGATYEPRRISEKVLSRLRGPLDFIILLVTTAGESMWTRDEIGAAVHHDIALIPLVEEGAKLEAGLFGDVEFIRFSPGHIGDAFLKLLQAVNFIRVQKLDSDAQKTATFTPVPEA